MVGRSPQLWKLVPTPAQAGLFQYSTAALEISDMTRQAVFDAAIQAELATKEPLNTVRQSRQKNDEHAWTLANDRRLLNSVSFLALPLTISAMVSEWEKELSSPRTRTAMFGWLVVGMDTVLAAMKSSMAVKLRMICIMRGIEVKELRR